MPRLPRILRIAATATSLLLCLATIGSWVRSHRVVDYWAWSNGADRPPHVYRMGHRYVLAIARGRVYVAHDTSWWFPPQFRYTHFDAAAGWVLSPDVTYRSALGFRWAAHVGTPAASSVPMPPFLLYRIVAVPHAFLVASLAALPGLHLASARRRRRRRAANRCPHCGYDLRAHPQSCPECGKAQGDITEAR